MKIKLKKPSNSKSRTVSNKKHQSEMDPSAPLGSSYEQLSDKKFLKEKRKRAKKNDTLENYCEMLETQLSSMTEKMLRASEPIDSIAYHAESDCITFASKEDYDRSPELEHVISVKELFKQIKKTRRINNRTIKLKK